MKKILITSALPYVNNVPHLGNIIGAVLSADVFARFSRSFGYDTIFICGSDEHGTATETKAMEEGVTPRELCDKYHKLHKEIYKWFNISFDHYGRTSTPEHKEITQQIFLKLKKNGFIAEEELEQLYCKKCDKFLADRFVTGTCPVCGYTEARGDQCEKCGTMLNAIELKDPRCKICNSSPIARKSEHLFIDLPKLKDHLLEWMDKRSGNWSQNARTITYAWIKEGLKKRAISRDLKWGIPIPLEKYKDKVFYVWFDAPIGYISITKEKFPDTWKDWWMNDKKVNLFQFMGKDNIPFHTIIFPSTLLGTKDPYTMLHQISSTEYLNYEKGKFSKSRNEGIFGNQAAETGIPADVFRYYLLINRPEKSDSAFTWNDFQEKNNNELVANIGNLVNRTITFIKKYFDKKIPKPELQEQDTVFLGEIVKIYEMISDDLHSVKLKDALKEIMQVSKSANVYFQENAPWKMIREDPARAATSLYVLVNIVKDLAIMIEPYMPEVSSSIFSQLNLEKKDWNDLGKLSIESGHIINGPKILFVKIEDKKIEELKKRFSGIQEFPLNLKVARVLEAKKHPDSEKLIILQVDIGSEKRQIVAGLQKYYSPEQMTGKNIVIVSNLKKAKLGGEESNGMLLAAEKGDKVILLEIPEAKPGENVLPPGMRVNESEITFKEFLQVKLIIKDKCMSLEGVKLKTPSGKFAVADLPDGASIH